MKNGFPFRQLFACACVSFVALSPSASSLRADPVVYVDRASSWSYFPGTEEASSPDETAWREVGFDDDHWATGDAPFGYDDGPFGTDLSTLNPPMRSNYSTLYLRQTFNLTNAAAVVSLEASVNYDDGFIVWINGTEVLSQNAPATPDFDEFAPTGHESGEHEAFGLPDPDGYLVNGDNVVAVQVFNTSITSSDLHFDIDIIDPIGVDASAPRAIGIVPSPGSRIRSLDQIQVTFDEAVSGVDAADLRINGSPASSVTGNAAGPYTFSFAEPPDGPVDVEWRASHGIEDLAPAPNAFLGGSWDYDLDPNAPLGMLVINEILTSNQGGHTDENGSTPDWFEITNLGAEAVDIGGWSVTDDPNEPGKFILPSRTLGPNQYLVVFASAEDRAPVSGNIHTSFKLNSAPDYLGLFSNDVPRQPVSELAPNYPFQRTNVAYGRTGAGTYAYLTKPTPGSSNSTSQTVDGIVDDPIFSHPHGYYDDSFNLTLSSPTPDAEIWYTTDGSEPADGRGSRYQNPISISGSNARAVRMIRAVAVKDGFLSSNVLTQSYLFASNVIRQPSNPSGFPSSWPGTSADYEMDPNVINSGSNDDMAIGALTTLPTISIVSDVDGLFGSSNGMITHPSRSGDAWEREVSAELIHPQGGKGFQIICGARIQGGSSTGGWKSKKNSIRLAFRGDYGFTKLRYQFFEDSPVDRFDNLVLDAHLNLTFTHPSEGQRIQSQYVRDMYMSDLQLAMGSLAPHSRLCNVFINGLFWGVFDVHERPDDSYCEEYLGGEKDEWDVFRHSGSNVIDGNGASWNTMIGRVRQNQSSNANYHAAAEYLDMVDLADYMIVNFYGGNTDWPHHNWFAARRRASGELFRFFSWDAEHVLKSATENRINDGDNNTPGEIFQRVRANAEFRLLFADRAHYAFFNGGPMYVDPQRRSWDEENPERNMPAKLYMERINEINEAMALESARWGDVRREPPHTRENTFLPELNRLLTSYFPNRSNTVLNQFRSANLYPDVDAPVFNQHGGEVAPEFSLTIRRPAGQGGTIYYTTDRSDPREFGGAVGGTAASYSGSISIETSMVVKARIRDGNDWSALNEATFTVPDQYVDLRPTEVMYHAAAGSQYDFLELKNTGPTSINLSGLIFHEGIDFQFPDGSILAPGEFFVLVANEASFDVAYPGIGADGIFTGGLDNAGERITLVDALGAEVLSFAYNDSTLWPMAADGFGFSLVLDDFGGTLSNPASWRASSQVFGSPGEDDPAPPNRGVVISEVLTRSSLPFEDAIELENITASPINIGGWYLSDDRDSFATLKKFRIPDGTIIPAGGFLVFYENEFNASPGDPSSFALGGSGDQVYLSSADPATTDLTGHITGASFDALDENSSFGRYETSIGPDYTPLLSRTFGADDPASVGEFRTGLGDENDEPRVGPVVIHEINYNPGPGADEFIEIANITGARVDLYNDSVHRGWQLRGVSNVSETDSFEFPEGADIGGNGFALIVPIDPSLFRARHGIPGSIPVYGPYGGALDNGGERLELMRPAPLSLPGDDQAFVLVDKVVFDDGDDWPLVADGFGPSLERRVAGDYGNDPENWGASTTSDGSPGGGNTIGPPPPNQLPVARFTTSPSNGEAPLTVRFDASSSSDPDGRIVSYAWTFDDGSSGSGRVVDHTFDDPGTYSVTLRVVDDDDDEDSVSHDVVVTVPLPNEDPTAAFSFDPPSGEASLTVNFDASDSNDPDGNIVSYSWDFDDGSVGSGRVLGHTFTQAGDYDVTLTVEDDDGATDATAHRITVLPPGPNQSPIPSFTVSPPSGPPPLQVVVDASDSDDPDGNIVRYTWDFGDGGVGLGRTIGHTYTEAGEYTIELTVEDDDGGEARLTKSVTVGDGLPNQRPVASFTASPETGEAPLQVIFDASGSSDSDGTIDRYTWDFGDGGVGLGRIIGHTFTEDGVYIVELTVEDDDGATAITTKTITVGDVPNDDPIASFTVTPDRGAPPLEIEVDASASSDPDGTIERFEWDWGDGTSGLGRTLTHTYTREGTFTITLIVRDDRGAFDAATATVTVEDEAEGGQQKPGDCNQDGSVDLSDGICVLRHLFLGQPEVLPCGNGNYRDAPNLQLLDTNNDGGGDLADAIHILTYLFQGGPAPHGGEACLPIFGCPHVCVE